jgi:hypothetical protein
MTENSIKGVAAYQKNNKILTYSRLTPDLAFRMMKKGERLVNCLYNIFNYPVKNKRNPQVPNPFRTPALKFRKSESEPYIITTDYWLAVQIKKINLLLYA